ncbi:MAG TPA: matrixin family metalloprotease, partial [Nitrosopumilaceae archaeon]|nr:matrixin family metalloprotease [Nitrosopumilaceae archaeon]
VIPYSLYTMTLVGQEYKVEDLGSIKSSYVIQNLKGDKIDTWLSWRLTDNTLYVNILNANEYPEKAETVKDAILSTEFYEIDDNLLGKAPKGTITKYYLGWAGALETASQEFTAFQIPNNFIISEEPNGAGDITITLANTASGDGYSGITKTIADDSQNQILKSGITIYDVENLSKNQLTTILRHEFGHALGLAHSTAEEDLMHPEIKSKYPYISHCDINAIVELYDGSQKSEVVCEK